MAKKWICLILAAVLACSLCACGEKEPADVSACKAAAEKFVTAYQTYDRATQFSMTFYDARKKWEEEAIKDAGSAEEFFALVQQQADAQGIDVTINSFDDYYAAYHQQDLIYKKDAYGAYSLTVSATECTKMDAETYASFCNNLLDIIPADYIDGEALKAVTEAYRVTVNFHIDGEKKDINEDFLVFMVYSNGRWLVANRGT
jgi:hypothetical protein